MTDTAAAPATTTTEPPAAESAAPAAFDRAAAFAEMSAKANAEIATLDGPAVAPGTELQQQTGDGGDDEHQEGEHQPEIGAEGEGGEPAAATTESAPAGEPDGEKKEGGDKPPEAGAPAKAGAPEKSSTPAKPAPKPDDDPLASLPEPQRKAIEAKVKREVDHRVKSALGRMRPKTETAAKAPDLTETQEAKEARAEWEQFNKQYPVAAKGLVALLKANGLATADHKELMKYVSAQKATTEQVALEDEDAAAEEAIASRHPDYVEILKDPTFAEWRKKQTKAINALGASRDVADSIRLLDLYRLDHPRATPAGSTAADAPNDDPKGKQPPADPKAAQAAARRQHQAAGAKAPTAEAKASPTAPNLSDRATLFRQYSEKANKEIARFDQ